MKRNLLFLSVFFLALSVSAQVKWNAADLGLEADAVAFKGIENGGPEEVKLSNLTFIPEGQSDWAYKLSEGEFTYNEQVYGQTQIQGATNGMTGYMVHANGPSSVAHFIPEANGTIDIAFKFGYNKTFWVAELTEADLDVADFGTDMSAYAYNNSEFWGGYFDPTNGSYYTADAPNDQPAEGTYYTGVTINVEANKHYYVWFSGSKIMLAGFTFHSTSSSEMIDAAKATVISTEYYSITGQKLAEPSKGINIVLKKMSDGTVETSKAVIY